MGERVHDRIEHDSLGALSVPATALYGIHTVRSLQNLSFSGRPLGGNVPYVRALGAVKRAAARANEEAGVLSRDLRRRSKPRPRPSSGENTSISCRPTCWAVAAPSACT